MVPVNCVHRAIQVCSRQLMAAVSSVQPIITLMEVKRVNSVLAPQLLILDLCSNGGTTCPVMPAYTAAVSQIQVSLAVRSDRYI